MAGTTKKIEEAATALEKGLIKKAVLITDSSKTQEAHKLVVGIAKQCISDKENCNNFCKEGAVKLKDMITPTTDNNDDLAEILAEEESRVETPEKPPASQITPVAQKSPEPSEEKPVAKTDEELFLDCPDCNVAAAAVEFVKIAKTDECDGKQVTEKLQPLLDDQDTTPEKWIKTMAEITETATCNKLKYSHVLGDLTEYLESKGGVFLNNLDKG